MKKTLSALLISLPALLITLAPLSAAVNLSGTVDWTGAETIAPGILVSAFQLNEPRIMRGCFVRIDLKTPGLKLRLPVRDPQWGRPMPDCKPKADGTRWLIRTRRQTCRQIMTDRRRAGENMVLIVNASGWRPWEPPWNQPYADQLSLVISDGVLVSPATVGRQSFLFYADGTVKLETTGPETDLTGVVQAITGYGFVLRGGVPEHNDNPKGNLHPRTGFGLSADHRWFYIVVIDGRQKNYSMGATTFEVGQLLAHAGAAEGVNMDGGGSTTLLSWESTAGAIRKHNTHNGDLSRPGSERTVGGWLGFVVDPEVKP